MQRIRAGWLLVCFCVTVAGVVSCGSGSRSSAGTSKDSPKSVGSVSGLLAKNSNGIVSLVYGALPAGSTPVVGARVSVVGGPSGTTAIDGGFLLDKVTFGTQQLKIQPVGAPPIDVPLTVLPEATIRVGDPPTTRSAAIAAAKSWLAGKIPIKSATLFASQQPLPVGVETTSAFNVELTNPVRTTAAPEWLIYVDRAPSARFGHAVDYIFIDAQTGALTTVVGDCWPLVNREGFFSGSPTSISGDVVQLGVRRAASIAASRTGALPIFPAARAAIGRDHVADPDHLARTYTLMLQGGERNPAENERPSFQADADRLGKFVGNSAFPPAAETVIYNSWTDSDDSWGDRYELFPYYAPDMSLRHIDFSTFRVKYLQLVQKRMDAMFSKMQSRDYFLLYISAHGVDINDTYNFLPAVHVRYNLHDIPDFGQVFGGETSTLILVPLNTLDFSKCKACHIAIIADTCYSNTMVDNMIQVLQDQKGKEVLLVGAADGEAFDILDPTHDPQPPGMTLPVGGIMSTLMIDALSNGKVGSGFYSGVGDAVTQASAVITTFRKQQPRVWMRTVPPEESCVDAAETITVRSAAAGAKRK